MKYLCYYDYNQGGHPSRSNSPASATKILYVAKCMAEIEPTEIVSASGVLGANSDSARVDCITKQLSIRYFFSIGRKNKILGKLSTALVQMQLFLYLLFNVSKNETIIVYHSLAYMNLVQIAKKIKGFRLVLEVEEIYADVIGDAKIRQKEIAAMKKANAYILATEALSKQIPAGRPYIVVNGTYQSEPPHNVHFDDDKIHCVYAGTFDPTKGGAAAAAAAAEFLPQNYHVHILGFGSEEQTENLKKQIAEVQKTAKCTLAYDGLKSGEEYIQFLQKCHIGLCTQIPDAKYTETSFPSKVLVYLANGLRVLSVRIPAVEQSDVGDMLYYYDEQKPEKIAEAIQSIDMNLPYDSRERLEMLDIKATKDIQELLKEI